MKNRKWVLAGSTIVASAAMIVPLTSLVACQNKNIEFKANAEVQDFSGTGYEFEIPVTFSYTPKNLVNISLIPNGSGDLVGLKLVEDSIKIENKKATIKLSIDPAVLRESKLFNFGVKFNYSDLDEPFELNGFTICYEYVAPEVRDKITLIGSRTISTSETSYKYKILFENKPIKGSITTQARNIQKSRDANVTFTEGGEIVEEHGYNYFYFEIGFNGATDSNLVISFDINIQFRNIHEVEQDETIYGCTMIYLK